jgi:hypothetical protein
MAASYADDVVSDDRRSGVSSGVTIGREALLALVRGLVEVGFTRVTTTPIAIRGEGLALVRRTWHRPDGFNLPLVAVVEYDADDRMTANVMFDAEDLVGAVYELDQRYLAGEGAEHAWMLRPSAEFWRCYNTRDWDGIRRGIAGEMTLVDHQPLSAGTTIQTADQFVSYAQGMVDLVPDIVAFEAEYLAVGRTWAVTRQVAHGTSTAGAEVERTSLILADMRDGRFNRTETFGPDRLYDALARFEALETEERAPWQRGAHPPD